MFEPEDHPNVFPVSGGPLTPPFIHMAGRVLNRRGEPAENLWLVPG
jgi:hypothetical protein